MSSLPFGAASANVVDEIPDDLTAARRMCDFGMKLHTVERFRAVAHGRTGAGAGPR